MKFKKYTVFVAVLLLSVLHSTGLQELESVLDEKTQTQQFVSYDCAKRAFGRIKGGIEYLLPFMSTIPNYCMRNSASAVFALCS